MENPRDIPRFNGYQPSPRDFDAARTQIYTPFAYIDFDLSVAMTASDPLSIFNVSGDFLYFDKNPAFAGNATLELNTQQAVARAPMYVDAGFALAATFKQIRMTWAAQPGRFLRLLYSTGDRIFPAAASIATIGTITNPVKISDTDGSAIKALTAFEALVAADNYLLGQDGGFNYGVSYANTGTLAANTPGVIIAAASNTAGFTLWSAQASPSAGSNGIGSFISKATAPVGIADGEVLQVYGIGVGANNNCPDVPRARRVSSGKRLDRISSVIETGVLASALYTLF